MTTWAGFGEGTFHDPDRYVREGRAEQPRGHDIGPIGAEIDSFLVEGMFYLRYLGETYLSHMTAETAAALELTDALEVTEALKIMYPDA